MSTENKTDKLPFFIKYSTVMIFVMPIVLSVMAFYIGVLTTEVKFYKQGVGLNAGGNNAANIPAQAQEEEIPENLAKPTAADHKRGSITPKLALIEYSDFDCPFCATFHPTAQRAVEEFPELVWIYRHFPLSIHPEAEAKSIASECVYKLSQNSDEAFWKIADIFFERKPTLEDLPKIVASEFGISEQAYKSCVDNNETEARVQLDMDTATEANVRGTPANFIMDLETGEIVPISGAQPYEVVKKAIESLL